MKTKILFAFTLLAIFILYSIFLERSPVGLNEDELGFALNAYSVSQTGFDENGRFLPLYFLHLGSLWATPIIVYLTALFLKVLPLSETTIRFPSVFIALLNFLLVFVLASRLFKSPRYALLAALFLALTPVHFIQGRILLDNLFIVPFVLLWLLFLHLFLKRQRLWYLFAATLFLGVGVHSYHAAKIMMPLYFLFTLLVLRPPVKVAVAGLALPLLPLVPWLAQYPATFTSQIEYAGLDFRLDVFFSYFNPHFLFFRGDTSLIHSTGKFSGLLLPFLIFIPFGIYRAAKTRDRFILLLILGFFTAPAAAAVAGDHFRLSRALVILPFATLLAVYGLEFMLRERFVFRVLATALLIIIPLQFAYFVYDYFTGYPARSYSWFKYNIPGALEAAISEDARNPAEHIYLDKKIVSIERYWRFFLIKNNKQELVVKTVYFDPQTIELNKVPANTLVVYNFNNVDGQKEKIGPLQKIATIFEPDHTSSFYLYRD